MRRWLGTLGLAAAAASGLAACSAPQRAGLPEGSGLWIAPDTFTTAAEAERQLAAFPPERIGHLIVELGDLGWRQGSPAWEGSWPRGWRPDRPTILALRLGEQGFDGAVDARGDLARLAHDLAVVAEGRGLTVRGLHLQFREPEWRTVATTLRGLRDELPEGWTLAAGSLDPRLDLEAWDRLAEVADLVVPTLYGQDPLLPDLPAAWDLRRIEERVQALAGLDRPFMAMVVTIGGVAVTAPGGSERRVSTTASLVEVGRAPGLRPEPGFPWEGVDRQFHTFHAASPVELTGLGLVERGSRVHAARSTDAHLSELLRRLRAWAVPGFHGVMLYRLPLPGERTPLSVEELARSVALRPRAARFATTVERVGGTARAPRLRARLEGLESGRTDLTFHGGNVLEVRSVGGGYFSGVEVGGFERFAQLRLQEDGTAVPELRRPHLLRFYFTVLDEGEALAAGPLRWHPTSAESRIVVGGQVVLPIGKAQRLPTAEFPEPAGSDSAPSLPAAASTPTESLAVGVAGAR